MVMVFTSWLDFREMWSLGMREIPISELLIGGSLLAPEANGFIVMNDGKFVVRDQIISKVNSSILFDFDRLEVQEFKGRIGRSGTIQAIGALKLFKPALKRFLWPSPLRRPESRCLLLI